MGDPPVISVLFVLVLIAWRVQCMDLAKRHNSDKEANRVRIPSSLCGGESSPLGMESGQITDQQIVASSSYNLQSVGPQNARLNREISGGAWCPSKQLSAENSGKEWIQVDLAGYYVISAIATQGRFGNGMGVEFAEEYWIEYSRDNGTTWNKWTDMSGDYKLPGNHDPYNAHKNVLSHPLVGINLIRIVPFANYQRTTCLRFELYGCKHDHTLPLTYSMPDGFKGSSLGDLRDLTYDGRHDYYGLLNGGLGQLTDGIKGDDNYKVNYGFEWIGWRTEGSDLSLMFQFDTFVNFTSATFYCHNLFSKDVQVFSGAKVWFSYDGSTWSRRPIEFEYMPDSMLENGRDVVVHLHQRAGMFVKFDLQFSSKWIMISEVTFNTSPVEDNFTIGYEHLESPLESLDLTIRNRAMFPQTTFLIVFAVLFTVICSVVLFLLRLHLRRKEKAGHIVVCMKDLATTPLYCEPKDFSSTSSTISNTVTDPEYAVPDVALPYGQTERSGAMMPSMLAGVGNAVRMNNGGHLNSNLNMFGAGFTRIFMGGHLKANNKTTAPIPVTGTLGVMGKAATLAPTNNSTSNVVYSTQKFPYLGDAAVKTSGNGSSYSVNKASNVPCLSGAPVSVPVSSINGRQYYASTDLVVKSPKLSTKNGAGSGHSNPAIDQVSTGMTSNTIYNKRKFAASSEDAMTSGSTLKLKYSSTNGMGHSEQHIDEMKCIPEVSESDIEVIRAQYGQSRYGEVLLGRFRDSHTNQKVVTNCGGGNLRAKSSEAETSSDCNGNDQDKLTSGEDTLVILKTLEKEKLRSEFLHEMKSKWFISAKSERVAKLIGYLSTPRHIAMVLECGNTDLSHFLPNCDKKLIGIQELLHIGSEVAAGMRYLESLGYVLRDLSARNCIIYTSSLQVKITDTAAFVTGNGHEYCNGVALRWVAPEALINGLYTTKSDVYSFGVVLWEILTYCLVRPHHELDDQAFVQKIFAAYEAYISDASNECSSSSIYYQPTYASSSLNGDSLNSEEYGKYGQAGTTRLSYQLALPRPTICPADINNLIVECLQLNQHTRPSFRDITKFLNSTTSATAEQVYA